MGIYALTRHHTEKSKGIGFVITVLAMSKEKLLFTLLFRVFKYRRMSKMFVHQNI